MKYIFTSLIFSLLISPTIAQLNIEEIGYLDIPAMHSTIANDIWGYTDEYGNEYALVGTENGFSVVDISEPSEPEEVFWQTGLWSTWRDVKVYEDVAYVTTEALQGLMIVDLSGLPEDPDLPVTLYHGDPGGPWASAHNLYQKDGYVYIFGANRGVGGVLILDVHTDPLNPTEVGMFDNWYVHDGYVENDTGYFGHIHDGFFSIVDLTDKTSPVLLGTAITPSVFTHNIWVSEDGNYAFTTDEVSNGYIGAFDISDPTDIKYLDKIQSSPGSNFVPHNSFVHGNHLFTSYYSDGVVIHDITHPDNMVEVGNFDTSPFATPDFKGCWGVYPYFESGLIVASDRQEGLFVLDFEETYGAYLEGNITEEGTGFAINDVTISIGGTAISDESNVFGDYATGISETGTFEVTYFKLSYVPQTIPVDFETGEIAIQDVVLEKLPEFTVDIRVKDAVTGANIQDAEVKVKHTYTESHDTTDFIGKVEVPLYYEDNYEIIVGKWGYETTCATHLITGDSGEITVYLTPGYYDDFAFTYDWTINGWATNGLWERGIPNGVTGPEGAIENPYVDVPFDCDEYAMITGNNGITSGEEQVDNGVVILMSPTFDLSGYEDPHINFSLWFYNEGETAPNDTLVIEFLNGMGAISEVHKVHADNIAMSSWQGYSFKVSDHIPISATMRLRLKVADNASSEHITEVGFDAFSVTEFSLASADEISEKQEPLISLYPNPFSDQLQVTGITEGWIEVFDLSGRSVLEVPVEQTLNLAGLERGTYLFVIKDKDKNPLQVVQQIKY